MLCALAQVSAEVFCQCSLAGTCIEWRTLVSQCTDTWLPDSNSLHISMGLFCDAISERHRCSLKIHKNSTNVAAECHVIVHENFVQRSPLEEYSFKLTHYILRVL